MAVFVVSQEVVSYQCNQINEEIIAGNENPEEAPQQEIIYSLTSQVILPLSGIEIEPFQAIFNLILLILALLILIGSFGLGSGITFVIWIACIAHAMFTVHGSKQDARDRALRDAMSGDC